MAVCLDNKFDFETLRLCFIKIDFDVALGIDYSRLASRPDQVRGMCETAQIELAEIHGGRFYRD